MAQPTHILILAAGLGTRMKSKKAKVLHRAGGKALIEHVVDMALELAPPERVWVVVGHQADEVRTLLGPRGVGFVDQTEQKGTGHAVLAARAAMGAVEGNVAVLYGDCPMLTAATLGRLVALREQEEAAAAAITTVLDNPRGYGRVLRDTHGRMCRVVEERAATEEEKAIREVNAGIYCFRAAGLWDYLARIEPNNPVREYYLTDMVEILAAAGVKVASLFLPQESGELLGINNRVELAEVDQIFRARTVRRLMIEGVTIERPETVTIDADVRIGADTVVGPFAQIVGKTVIGEDCRIGACSIVSGSILGDRVEVLPFTIVNTSRVGDGAHVGPYARLRMDNDVEAGAQVGNFVELKKTRLGAGSKAMHLAYLGDSEIGPKVNVGAGTITCNYDGVRKSRTQIGAGAFVGSNSTLVAPLEIGAGAYVAAGSVITEGVPEDALALGRSRQVTKEGWARRRREAAKPRE